MPLFSQHTGRLPQQQVPSPQAAATLLRRYRPLETRATGGFGSVEICLDSRLQRRVAIKRIPLEAKGAPQPTGSTASALTEARTASMLQHPNIVSVIDFSFDTTYAYLVMEYVDGLSLEEFLEQVGGHSLTYDEAAHIADSLCQALAYAHENGVLHLDIKPANVLIDHSGHVKLTDFGMATLASAAGYGGARGGTIGYMAPEQLDGSIVDERSDIFSLAAVLYESLCGTAPFRAATPADSLKRIEVGATPPGNLLPDIPESAEDALLSALSPAPESRCASIEDFEDGFLAELGNTREGKKSLARMVARMTSDDGEAEYEDEEDESVETDPALGYLGTRFPSARRVLYSALSGASIAFCSYRVLTTLGVQSLAALASALLIGAAAGAAPQIGSALLFTGFLTMVVNATPLVGALPSIALILAMGISWWLVWGRTDARASACLVLACTIVNLPGVPVEAALTAAVACGFFLAPASAGICCAIGLVCGRALAAACAAGGSLDAGQLAGAFIDLSYVAGALCCCLCAVGASAALSRAWSRYQNDGSTSGAALAYALPAVCAVAALCLAHPMEITSLSPVLVANTAGAGIISSIICWITVYLFGLDRNHAESDRS